MARQKEGTEGRQRGRKVRKRASVNGNRNLSGLPV